VSDQTSSRTGEVLRLRNLVMIENTRRAEDPAWRGGLKRQQVVAQLGWLFGDWVDQRVMLQQLEEPLPMPWEEQRKLFDTLARSDMIDRSVA
jgi:hypothetical protein